MNKILIIHPHDATTDFLKNVEDNLTKKYPERVTILNPRIEHNQDIINDFINTNYNEQNDIIVFMGHGHSSMLYGGVDEQENKSDLISIESAKKLFHSKNVFLFSCNSGDYLKRCGENFSAYIGFGNMPTDWEEISSERDIGDYRYLQHLSEKGMRYYKVLLLDILIKSLGILLLSNGNYRKSFLLLRLLLNKALHEISKNEKWEKNEYIELFKLIQQTKKEISIKY